MCGSSTLTHGSARCPAGSGCRAHKTPGEPSIRCCRWQSITLHLVPAVAHPNRDEGDLRARVGLSAVLRVQAARLLLFAIEPPDDDTQLIVGIDKANAPPAHRQPSTGRCHAITRAARELWAVEDITDAPRLTIRQWHERYRTDRDHRRSDRWPLVLAAADHGLLQRADIIAIYEKSGSNQGAADKAINRWLKAGRPVKKAAGVSMSLATDEPRKSSKSVHVGFNGSKGSMGRDTGVAT